MEPAADTQAPEAFIEALEDDLNTPKAIAELFALAKAANIATNPADKAIIKAQILAAGPLIGLLEKTPAEWFGAAKSASAVDAATVEALIKARFNARANKDFAEADRIRVELDTMGVELNDSREGTTWKIKS